jgi:transcriptional regulator with XRE-family HTH domain
MTTFGDTIKNKRLSLGWSKRALAERADISHSEVHRIENGDRKNPSVPVLNALAEALGISKEDLLQVAGYKSDDGDVSAIERVFPALKTEQQRDAAEKIIEMLVRSDDLKDGDYEKLVDHMEMFFDYVKKKNSNK